MDRLCRNWGDLRDETVAGAGPGGTGMPSRRAYVEASRDAGGGWRIRREHLAMFIEHHRHPAVRVG